jgi:hypothetical protein
MYHTRWSVLHLCIIHTNRITVLDNKICIFFTCTYNVLLNTLTTLCDTNYLLKVLTNEKRGGLTVVSFDRSRFKLISRKFSHKLVQAPSCERHKTAPRTLFLLFTSNNCFPLSA